MSPALYSCHTKYMCWFFRSPTDTFQRWQFSGSTFVPVGVSGQFSSSAMAMVLHSSNISRWLTWWASFILEDSCFHGTFFFFFSFFFCKNTLHDNARLYPRQYLSAMVFCVDLYFSTNGKRKHCWSIFVSGMVVKLSSLLQQAVDAQF